MIEECEGGNGNMAVCKDRQSRHVCGDALPVNFGRNQVQTIVTPEKEIIRIGQIEIRFLIESNDSNGQLAMFEFTVPAGAKVPAPHSHTHYDETIYGLEGVMTFTVNGQPTDRPSCEARATQL